MGEWIDAFNYAGDAASAGLGGWRLYKVFQDAALERGMATQVPAGAVVERPIVTVRWPGPRLAPGQGVFDPRHQARLVGEARRRIAEGARRMTTYVREITHLRESLVEIRRQRGLDGFEFAQETWVRQIAPDALDLTQSDDYAKLLRSRDEFQPGLGSGRGPRFEPITPAPTFGRIVYQQSPRHLPYLERTRVNDLRSLADNNKNPAAVGRWFKAYEVQYPDGRKIVVKFKPRLEPVAESAIQAMNRGRRLLPFKIGGRACGWTLLIAGGLFDLWTRAATGQGLLERTIEAGAVVFAST